MTTLDDVARVALGLPAAAEGEQHGRRTWTVAGKAFAWERPFSKADLRRFGDATPSAGPIVALRVADLEEKQIVLAAGLPGFLTIPHFDGYAAVLVQLDAARRQHVEDAVVDAWLAAAPRKLARDHLADERDD